MTSILRQIVAGPRLRHPEAGLDLCYVTDDIIATSGPSSKFPRRAYRNPTDALVRFLDQKHGANWCIWEFRAEGTGYPDEEVYGRIHHFPWPDHHPPPFAVVPPLMASMRNWLCREEAHGKRVAVVHCKAGKGRSGTVACSYLISEQGWKSGDALKRFTERRMRLGFGPGVSLPSQVRWVNYVDRWTNELGKTYVERPVEILEIQLWGLRDGLKVEVEGYVEGGRKIKRFHRFQRSERTICDEGASPDSHSTRPHEEGEAGREPSITPLPKDASSIPFKDRALTKPESVAKTVVSLSPYSNPKPSATSVILRPHKRVIVPTSDVKIDFERRSKASYTDWLVVTSVAHVWFNAYFEGGHSHGSGVFEAEWNSLDGIKGTPSKGTRGLDRIKVLWRYPTPSSPEEGEEAVVPGGPPILGKLVSEPAPGEAVPEGHPADWRGEEVVVDKGEGFTDSDEPGRENVEEMNGPTREPSRELNITNGPRSLCMTAGRQAAQRQSTPRADVSFVNAAGDFNADKDNDPSPRP